MKSNCTNPIRPGIFVIPATGRGEFRSSSFPLPRPFLYNLDTAHGNVTKITQNIRLIILKLLASDIILTLLNLLAESKLRQSSQSEKCFKINSNVSDKIKKRPTYTQSFNNSRDVTMTSFLLKNDLR